MGAKFAALPSCNIHPSKTRTPTCGRPSTNDETGKRRFAGSARADDAECFARRQPERDITDGQLLGAWGATGETFDGNEAVRIG